MPVAAPINLPYNSFMTKSEVVLQADGENSGDTAYELIKQAYGNKSIESPDLYRKDHNDVTHIIEATDSVVGHHFVFLAHRDLDHNKGVAYDRQRNEIKVYDSSDDKLKAYQGETMQYRWQFKVPHALELSRGFSHFFQIKAKNKSEDNSNGNDNQPILTITGTEQHKGKQLEIRHSTGYQPDGGKAIDTFLVKEDWSLLAGQWVDIFVEITYAEKGELKVHITRLSDKQVIVSLHETNIDMWRGNERTDFARPKWGIYRSLKDKSSLRADEEQVHFANISIKKGVLK